MTRGALSVVTEWWPISTALVRGARKPRPSGVVPRQGGTEASAEHCGGEGETEAIQHFSEPAHGVLFPDAH